MRRVLSANAALAAAPDPGAPRASVALVLRPAVDDLELLLIRRAEREGDPWSGHMALPGGRADPADADARATAVRETQEEVGLALADGVELGALDEVAPFSRASPIIVSPFVFAVAGGTPVTPNHEVAAAVWIPIGELRAKEAITEYLHPLGVGAAVPFPALGTRGYVIWGLTHRILTRFLELHAHTVGLSREG